MLLIIFSKTDVVFLKVERGVASRQKGGGIFHQVTIRLSGCEVNFAVFGK